MQLVFISTLSAKCMRTIWFCFSIWFTAKSDIFTRN